MLVSCPTNPQQEPPLVSSYSSDSCVSGAIPKYKTIDGMIERLNRRTLATILVILGLVAAEDGLVGKRITCNGFKDFKKKNFIKVSQPRHFGQSVEVLLEPAGSHEAGQGSLSLLGYL